VIGGLSLSTLVTLFAVPTFYVAARGKQKDNEPPPASGAGFTPA